MTDALADLCKRYVIVGDERRFRDTLTNRPTSYDAIDALYGHWARNGATAKALRSTGRLSRVNKADYLPGERALILRQGDELVLNTWRPGELVPAPGRWDRVEALLKHILPDEAEREHVLDVLGHPMQHPAEKIRHGLLIRGPQGTGKSTLLHKIERLVGPTNAQTVPGEQVSPSPGNQR